MAFDKTGIVNAENVDVAVYLLKDDSGNSVKTYKVPVVEATAFETAIKEDIKNLSSSLGKELHLVKVTRCF